jgi:hypothetical protein
MDLIATLQDSGKPPSFVIRKITPNLSMTAILKLSKSGLSASAISFLPSRNWECSLFAIGSGDLRIWNPTLLE